MHLSPKALLRLIVPALAIVTWGCGGAPHDAPPQQPPGDAGPVGHTTTGVSGPLVEAMPVRVAIGNDDAPQGPVQQRPVTVVLNRNFVPGQEFSIAYEVRNQSGQLVPSNSVILPASPQSVKPAGPGAPSFTFNVQAKKKAATGNNYTVRVHVSFKTTDKPSVNTFPSSPLTP